VSFQIRDIDADELAIVEERLAAFDAAHFPMPTAGEVSLGAYVDGVLVGGANGEMSSYRIFYVSTLVVDEQHRGQGIGRTLMAALEEKARALGANLIRLDTFDFQAPEFYKRLGYTEVGSYQHPSDGFGEHFFVKYLD